MMGILSYVEKNPWRILWKVGSPQTEMALASRWKILNKKLEKWRDALAKVRDNVWSGENLGNMVHFL